MKRTVLSFILLMSAGIAAAQTDNFQHPKDSLHNLRRQELVNLFDNREIDEFRQKAGEFMPFFKANGYEKTYYYIYYFLVLSYGVTGEAEKVLPEAAKMYEEAKAENSLYGIAQATSIIARAYSIEHRYDYAEKYIGETMIAAENMLRKMPNDEDFHILMLMTYREKTNILLGMDKYDELFATMSLWRSAISKYGTLFGKITDPIMDYYNMNARIYANIEEYEKAEAYCDSVEQLNPEPGMIDRLWEYRSMIAEGRGQYEKSIYWLDKSLDFNENLGELAATIVFLRNKARLLSKLGRAEESYAIFDRAFQRADSVHNVDFNAQLDELRTQYEVDRHISEKERNRNYFLFALAGCILLAIALGIWIYYSRKIARKNRALALQIRAMTEQQELREAELLNKTSFVNEEYLSQIRESNDEFCPESRKDKLCIAIRDLILRDKAYRNPGITRDYVIERLGTNRELFVEAFMYCFGMSFPEYINTLRLKDAVTLLQQSDLTIEEISEKTGFGTVRTFQRQFQTRYGMSAKDYRISAKNR